ncbi:MAG: hypothetical protein JW850_04575 [Thermoflexales bacterium]|nr:hypothetical protein [Thermoflexales bacterium]
MSIIMPVKSLARRKRVVADQEAAFVAESPETWPVQDVQVIVAEPSAVMPKGGYVQVEWGTDVHIVLNGRYIPSEQCSCGVSHCPAIGIAAGICPVCGARRVGREFCLVDARHEHQHWAARLHAAHQRGLAGVRQGTPSLMIETVNLDDGTIDVRQTTVADYLRQVRFLDATWRPDVEARQAFLDAHGLTYPVY